MLSQAIARGTAPVLIDYVDAQGATSRRTVAPVALILPDSGRPKHDNSYLYARCSSARRMRQFRLDRIQAVADPRSGELYPNVAAWLDTVQVGPVEPWGDVAAPNPPADAAIQYVTVEVTRWRPIIATLLLGYAIGRLRLIPMILQALDLGWGSWL